MRGVAIFKPFWFFQLLIQGGIFQSACSLAVTCTVSPESYHTCPYGTVQCTVAGVSDLAGRGLHDWGGRRWRPTRQFLVVLESWRLLRSNQPQDEPKRDFLQGVCVTRTIGSCCISTMRIIRWEAPALWASLWSAGVYLPVNLVAIKKKKIKKVADQHIDYV